MASSSKTENYSLNQWVGTDKPMRTDFNEDNRIIDKTIFDHINDMSVHTYAVDKLQNESFAYLGDGAKTQKIVLNFEPDSILVLSLSHAPIEYTSSVVKWYFGAAIKGLDGNGITIDGVNVTVEQRTLTSGAKDLCCLNTLGETYMIVAMRHSHS